MERVWLRLGGYVTVRNTEQLKRIMQGDAAALREAINADGFDIDGDAVIPIDGDDEINFVL